ncbi:hypothetical protein A3J43_02900 [Candidatus Uhrbacteria bacterium RIFCSPHIGHO2_12_FULL_54_23]|uniref:Putative pterin-4-alpha-carbinolamine dehydratase n=3 Tax=Candidatus Uhriibacteriota TaxID=1752732 RepID=A0A1F7UHW3_9BACT|nr:MAG: hypothetical protein A3J43_02900 [Candidatus Uhrbacteria bacterium RIFCSPHIGHO2_12_FULL_54_23]OGL85536.1 MAG: hypothetical protein A3B36_00550 [Candidatus Uhrbacteria bacterium RIFCSPLOWO2_01_FULL_55_36]OGL89622.1 MAG: hypothetical protein A3J36_01130 [Candidatus Uhrbacteria bacterium RIFCSPLOWO2_02_FULL_54_37]
MFTLPKKCIPCEGGINPLPREKVEEYLKVVPGWTHRQTPSSADLRFADGFGKARASAGGQGDMGIHDQIEREFKFKDFKEAVAFINKVAEIAEEEGHHPNIYLHGWNKVRLEMYTHAIGGLHENDFVIAAKVNAMI